MGFLGGSVFPNESAFIFCCKENEYFVKLYKIIKEAIACDHEAPL